MNSYDAEELSAKRICSNCVGEAFLSARVAEDGVPDFCSYCDEDSFSTWSIGDMADAVDAAFNDHMIRTATAPEDHERALYADRELNLSWYRNGQATADAIEDSAAIPSAAAHDVQAVLENRHADVERDRMGEETEYASDACYEEKRTDATAWHWAWAEFERSLQADARFFNRSGAEVLKRVFGSIDELRTKPRHPAVVTAGPGRRLSHLYRARVFQADSKLQEAICMPDVHIGTPPAKLSSAGRMNAKGISVFYGATKGQVALAEVRPPVGSKVVIARFDIVRPLKLLDLTALAHAKDGGSIFDPTLKERLERVAFLQSLGERMTRPVMPDDEAFDYLITQAIADFLGSENEPRLDGIIFASAQVKSGSNVVLLHAASRVEAMPLPQGTRVLGSTASYDEDGSVPDYQVWEEVPPSVTKEPGEFDDPVLADDWPRWALDDDAREPALRVDPSSAVVHHIEYVQVRSSPFSVHRRRLVRSTD